MKIKNPKRGSESHGQSSTHVNVRIPDTLFEKIDLLSKKHGVTRSAVIISILESIQGQEKKVINE